MREGVGEGGIGQAGIGEIGRELGRWKFVCLFVCLFNNRSVRADTRMGPEGTKLKQKPEPGLKILYIACRL